MDAEQQAYKTAANIGDTDGAWSEDPDFAELSSWPRSGRRFPSSRVSLSTGSRALLALSVSLAIVSFLGRSCTLVV